jgi:hypothetical protein
MISPTEQLALLEIYIIYLRKLPFICPDLVTYALEDPCPAGRAYQVLLPIGVPEAC